MITSEGNIFKNNNATSAGVLYNNATVSANSNTFIANSATNGGALIDNGTFSGRGNNYYNNTALENGGAIYACSDRNIVIQQIEVDGNTAGQNGGAIFTEENVVITSSRDVKYVNNSAILGGAVYLGNQSNITTSADEFINNNASMGGAIYAQANNTVTVKTSTTFDSNKATLGGAIYLNDTVVLNSTNGIYKNGNATNGSAIYAQKGSQLITNGNQFIKNNADNGALYIDEGVTVSLSSGQYTNNTASKGAAIYTKSDLNTSTVTFTQNNATQGGAIYLDEVIYNSQHDTFSSNKATQGGAIYVSNDSKANISSSMFNQNNATEGGVLYLDGNAEVNTTGSTYGHNRASNDGGVMYVTQGATVNVLGSDTYTDNTANYGGVFYNRGNINSTGNIYTKDTATASGGVLYNVADANFTANNDEFTLNNAPDGAVLENRGNVTITESTIDSNIGTKSVILNLGVLTLTDNTVSNNKVTSPTGYVILNSVVSATIVNNLFDSNTDLTRDMLLGEVQPQSITGNTYIDNYLNDTIDIPVLIDVPLEVLEYFVNVTVNLRNIYNDTVRNGTVYLYDEEFNRIGEGRVIDGNASVRIYRPSIKKSLTNATAVYQSLSHHYQDMNVKTEVHMGKPTRIVISPINQTYVDDKINVTVSLYEIENNTLLKNANITVYINGTKYTRNTGENGYVVIQNISFPIYGNYPMNASFEGNSSHVNSNTTGTIEIIKIPTHMVLTLPNNVSHPDDEGYINVTLYDSRNNSTLRVFNITLNVTNKTGIVKVPDENGNITYLFKAYENGHIQVVASVHESSDQYAIPAEVSGQLFIERYPTHFHSNTTALPSGGGDVNITFTLYDIDHNLIKNKTINITTIKNGTVIESIVVKTDDLASYTVNVTINTNDNVTITAYCLEDYKYRNSSLPVHLLLGKNTTWVAVSPNNTYVNRTSVVRINLEENGNTPLTGKVNLTVGEHEPLELNVINGEVYYEIPWTWPERTTVQVSVSYAGDEHHAASSATATFTVFRAATVTSIAVTENLDTKTVIVGNVTSEGYPSINIGNVTLTAEYTNFTTGLRERIELGNVTVVNGKYELVTDKLEVLEADYGRYNIRALYNTNNVFYESQAETGTIRITSFKNTTVTISTIERTTVGTEESILFSLSDEKGEQLANKTLIITINGTDYTESNLTTDSNGTVRLFVSFDKVALNNITVKFDGDDYYNSSSNTHQITVKQRTITTITVPSPIHVYDNVTINITLKDIDGNPLANESIIANDHEHQDTFITDENGTISIPVFYTTYGTKNVTAEFKGSLFYLNSYTKDIIQVLRLDSMLNVTSETPVLVGNVTQLGGYLVLHNGTPIVNATVQMYINNAAEAINLRTNEEGYYYYNYTTSVLGRNDVRVVFETNNVYWGSHDTATFIVKPYVTDISVSADRLIKVGDTTTITGILEDEFGNKLGNKIVNLTINGVVVAHDTTDYDGSYEFNFTQAKDGIYNITVNFTGDNKYLKSFDTYQIKVEKVITHINITGISPVNYGDKILVKGILFDEYGNVLDRQIITVYMNGIEKLNTSTRGLGDVNYTVTANEVGLQNITFRFNGTDKYYSSNNTYQVNVIKIYTHFDQLEATNVELGQNTTVIGYLIDESRRGLANTEFNVTLNGNESTTKTVKTDNRGRFSFEYNSTQLGLNNITLSYAGNYSQEPVDDYVTFTVDKLDVFITTNVTSVKAGNATILVNVTDENGDPIPEGTVLVYYDEDGEPIGNGTVGENGTVEISVPLEPGVQDIIIVYNGTEELYKSSRTVVTLEVPLYNLNITINDINDTKVRNSTNITGFLYYEDAEHNPIIGENLTIYVDGIAIANVTTGEDGNYSCQYNATTSGFKEVLVVFAGNSTHSRIEATGNFTVNKIISNINITNIENITVDYPVIINGTLVDEFDIIIPNAPVTIEINGVNYTNTTDDNGNYYIEYTTSVVGENNITVYYAGNNTFNSTANSTTFNVTAHPTNITANITNPRPGNNLITINVTDEKNNNVTTGKVTIKEGDKELGNGIIINGELVTAIVLNPGEHALNITYEGITKYSANSTIYTVTIPKINTTIIPEAVSAVKINDTIIVNGTLVDQFNNPVGPATVNISINGINATVPVDVDGKFTYTNTTNITGINNVTIVYDGNDTYNGSSVSFNFTVSPIFTQITANATSPIVINNTTTITGVLKDEKGNSISGASVEVWINGELNDTVTTDSEGNYTLSVVTDTLGLNNVTVIYKGNDTYTPVNTTTNYYVDKMFTAVNVTTISPIKVGTNTTISGRLVDGRGNPIKDAVVNITVEGDDTKYTATTDNDGYYTLNVTGTTVGDYKVKVFYNGTDVYIESNNTGKFIVEEHSSNVAINVSDIVNGKVNITVNVTDESGNAIPGGFVNITDENGTVIGNGTIDENGNLTTNITLPPGPHNITISYNGTTNSTPYNTTIVLNVPKYGINLTLEDINNTIVRNTTNITGTLKDTDGNNLDNVIVSIYVNNKFVTNATVTDGTYNYEYNATTTVLNTVRVVYEGNATYEAVEVNKTFEARQLTANATITEIENITIGNTTNINGTVTDEFNNIVADAEIILTVNGRNYTTTTNSTGGYNITLTAHVVGENNITVTFEGNNTISAFTNTSTFNVTRIKTTTTAEVITTVAGISLITVNVTDEFGQNVTDGPITVTDGTVTIATGKIVNGTAIISVPTEAGKEYTFTVKYDGTDIYENSTTTTTKNIPKLNTTIIPGAVNAVKINDTIIVNGTLVDQFNNPVGPATVNISINGINATVPVDVDGKFTYTNTTNITGINNVTIVYDGNDTYNGSSVSFNFTVSPIFTQITANATSPIVINNTTTITGVLKDEKGNSISGASVEVWINGELNDTVTTDSEGNYTLSVVTDTLGLNNVTVVYSGNSTYTAVNTTTYYYVDKMFTAVNVTTVSPVKVGSNTTISGRLVDGRGNGITDAVINITVGDSDKYNATTDNDGYYTLNVTGTTVGDYKVKVFYNGSEVYIESNNTGKFIVEEHSTNVEVNVSDIENGKVNITVNVTDEGGNAIPGGFVNITDENGNVIGNGTIDENGNLTTNITLPPGPHNITIVYNGTTNSTSYNKTIRLDVPKYDAKLSLEDINNTIVHNSTNITGLLVDENNNPITNANITITVDGLEIAKVITGEDGNYSVTYNATTVGEKQVIVNFAGDDTYAPLSVNKTFNVGPVHTNITVSDIDNITIGGVVNINGTLVDELGFNMSNVEVIITVNGKNYTATTDEYGNYSYNYTTGTAGVNNVTVTFIGDNNIIGTVNSTSFNVTRINTTTRANISSPRVGANIIEVNVTETISGLNVTYGPVEVRNDEGEVITIGQVINGTAYIPVSDLEAGREYNFTIVYNQTSVYEESSYKFNITIPEHILSVIPDATVPTKLGTETEITGTIVNENNEPLANTQINITVNGETKPVTTDENGKYELPYTTNTTGINNVTVSYTGEGYEPLEYKYNFTVDKLFSVINVTADTPIVVGNNTTISGRLVDETGEAISDVNVTITVNGVNVYNATTEEGYYSYNVTGSVVGLNNVTVEFAGNDNYTAVNRTTNFIVDKMFTGLTVSTISPIKVGSNTTINGTLVDGRGNPIKDAVINITVEGDDTKYTATTDSNGFYTLNVTGTTVGDYKVKVFYNGTDVYIESNNTGKFIVEEHSSHVEVNVSDIENGKVNITVNVTDEGGNAIPGGFVNITDENGTVIGNGTIDENGNLTTNITLPPGPHNITIVYNGTTNSTSFNKTIILDVPKYDAKLSLETVNDTIVHNSTNITGLLVDENNNPITNANITITVNGIEIAKVKTGDKGNYSVTYNPITTGDKLVVVNFAGDETYAPLTMNTTFNVKPVHTNITVPTLTSVTTGDIVKINGTLTDEFGLKVSDVDVIITVNGKNYTTTTDENGEYSYNYLTGLTGVNNVTVTFIGDNNLIGTSNKTTFNVSKEETNVVAEITPKPGTSLVDVKVTDSEGKPVTEGTVEIKDGDKVIGTGRVINGTVTISVPTEAGKTYNLDVVYDGTTVYGNSSSKIEETQIPKHNITVIPDPIKPVVIGETFNVSGKVVDENNRPIANTEINVTVNGETVPVKTDENGTYSYSYPTNSTGTNNITVSFEDEVHKVEYKYNFTVSPLITTITFETPSTIKLGLPSTINGILVDQYGKAVPNAKVTVKVGDKTLNATTDKNGKYSVTTTPTKVGINNIIVSYAGNETYRATDNTGVLLVDKLDTILTLNVSSPAKVGNVNITGTLLDENNKPVSNKPIKVTVNGKEYNTTTNSKGVYVLNNPTTTAGVNNVTVTYAGDGEHYLINNAKKFNVDTVDVVVDVAMPKVDAGNSNIVANITDENGKPVSTGTVTITTPDGKTIKAPVKDGKVNVTVPTTPGTQTYKVKYDGDNYTPSTKSFTVDVPKVNTTITTNKLTPAKVDDTTTVTGTLKDSNGKPIPNAEVTVKYANTTKVVKTDSNGKYTAAIPDVRAGTNPVTVTYSGNDTYNKVLLNTTQVVSKYNTKVKVDEISGIVGEKITLTAHVTDTNGKNITGGNLVFKLNGKTLREDYRFDSKAAPLKFKVVNGKVTVTLTADLYLRNVKNLTASYSGSYKYEASTSSVVTAQIQKRRATLTVTTVPTLGKQDNNIIFKAYLKDVTHNAKNKTSLSTDGTVIFKVNGNTIKDESGSQIHVDVINNVATYTYYVEPGTASVYKNGSIRHYSLEAVYDNPSFYPDTRNKTVFHVDKSDVTINFVKTTVKGTKLSVKATMTDYKGNNLVGNSTIAIKINGRTYQENGKAKYFNIVNGKVNLSGLKLSPGEKVHSVMIVTGERQSYHAARETTTDITTS
nr:Ig-like domain repeat protein [Methanosphaera sp. ISO3-F5]